MSDIKPKDIVVGNNNTPQDIENQKFTPPTNLKYLEGFIETLSTIPTFTPKKFWDSVKIVDDGVNYRLYIFNSKSGVWKYVNLS